MHRWVGDKALGAGQGTYLQYVLCTGGMSILRPGRWKAEGQGLRQSVGGRDAARLALHLGSACCLLTSANLRTCPGFFGAGRELRQAGGLPAV